MTTFQKIIKITDAVCSCIPILSTVTEGAQLLYKVARKTDAVANPVTATWRDEIKIHVLNKTHFENLIGMIPILGNLTNLIYLILNGFRDDLISSAVNSRTEAIKLYLLRHPLTDDQRAEKILNQAAYSCKLEGLKSILDSRDWSADAVIRALRVVSSPESEEKADLILDYYKEHFPSNSWKETSIIGALERHLGNGNAKIVDKILDILPKCNFALVAEILPKYSCSSFDSCNSNYSNRSLLTKDRIEKIVAQCNPCNLRDLASYCEKVHQKAENINKNIAIINDCNREYRLKPQLDREGIVNEFRELHNEIIQKLLNSTVEVEKTDTNLIIETLSNLANHGEIKRLEMFLVKYSSQLTSEDKFNLLKKTRQPFLEEDGVALKGFEHLFGEYNSELTDEQCGELLEQFQYLDNSKPFIERMLTSRPHLISTHKSAVL